MRRFWWFTVGLVAVLTAPLVAETDSSRTTRLALQAEALDLAALGWEDRLGDPVGPATEAYRQHLVKIAGAAFVPNRHRLGRLEAQVGGRALILGVNVFVPDGEPVGTLAFVHGYMSHAGNFAYTYRWFLDRGWRIVTLDLPGHGASNGKRADIDDFRDYGDAVVAWWAWLEAQGWAGRRLLMAHSLGTAACFEALRRPQGPRPDQVVFCAPLLRTDWFDALALGGALTRGWLPELPGQYKWDGYLDGDRIPPHWFVALAAWLKRLEKQRPLDLPLWLYTGDQDRTVDEDWNRRAYQRLVPRLKTVVFAGEDHLFLADKRFREAFHRRLSDDLGLEAGSERP